VKILVPLKKFSARSFRDAFGQHPKPPAVKTSIGGIRQYFAGKTDDILRIHRQQSAIEEVMKISPQK
jgi:hypothetical protein